MTKNKKKFYKLIVGSTTLLSTGFLGITSISCNFKRVDSKNTNTPGGDWSKESTKPGTLAPATKYDELAKITDINQIFKNITLNQSYAQKTPLDTFIKNYNNAFKVLNDKNATLPFERVENSDDISEKYIKTSASRFETRFATYFNNENKIYLGFFGYYTEAKRVNDKLVVNFYATNLVSKNAQGQYDILTKEMTFDYPNLTPVVEPEKTKETESNTPRNEEVNSLLNKVTISFVPNFNVSEVLASQVKISDLVFKIDNQVTELVNDVKLIIDGENSLNVEFKVTKDQQASSPRTITLTGFKILNDLEKLEQEDNILFQKYNNVTLYSPVSPNDSSLLLANRVNERTFKLIANDNEVKLSDISYVINPYVGYVTVHFGISRKEKVYRVSKTFPLQKVPNILEYVNQGLNIYVGYYKSDIELAKLRDAIIKFENKTNKSEQELEIAKNKVLEYIYLKNLVANHESALAKVEEFKQLVASQVEVIENNKRNYAKEVTVLASLYNELRDTIIKLNFLNMTDSSYQNRDLHLFLENFFNDFIDNYYYGTKVVDSQTVMQNEYGSYGLWYINIPSILAKNLLYRVGDFSDDLILKASKVINHFVSDFSKYSPLPYSKNTYGDKIIDTPWHIADLLIAKTFSLINDDPNKDLEKVPTKLIQVYDSIIANDKLLPSNFDETQLSTYVNVIRILGNLVKMNFDIYGIYNDLDHVISYLGTKLSVDYASKWNSDKLNDANWVNLAKNMKIAEFRRDQNQFTNWFDNQILQRSQRIKSMNLVNNSWDSADVFVNKFNNLNKSGAYWDKTKTDKTYEQFIQNISEHTSKFEKYSLNLIQPDSSKPNDLILEVWISDLTNDSQYRDGYRLALTYSNLSVPNFEVLHNLMDADSRSKILPSQVTTELLNLRSNDPNVLIKDVVLKPNDVEKNLTVSYKYVSHGKTFNASELVINGFVSINNYLNDLIETNTIFPSLKDDVDKENTYASSVVLDNFKLNESLPSGILNNAQLSSNNETGSVEYTLKLELLDSNQQILGSASKLFNFDGFKVTELGRVISQARVISSDTNKLASSAQVSDFNVSAPSNASEFTPTFKILEAIDSESKVIVKLTMSKDGETLSKDVEISGYLNPQGDLDQKANQIGNNYKVESFDKFSTDTFDAPSAPDGYTITNFSFTPISKFGDLAKFSFTLIQNNSNLSSTYESSEFVLNNQNKGNEALRTNLINQSLFGSEYKKATDKTLGTPSEETKKIKNRLVEFLNKTSWNDDEAAFKDDMVAVFVYAVDETNGTANAKKVVEYATAHNENSNIEALKLIKNTLSKFSLLVSHYVNGSSEIVDDKVKEFVNNFMDKFFTTYYSTDLGFDASSSANYSMWYTQIPFEISKTLLYGSKVYSNDVLAKSAKVINAFIRDFSKYNRTPVGNFAWGNGKAIDNLGHAKNVLLPKLVAMVNGHSNEELANVNDGLFALIDNLINNNKLVMNAKSDDTRNFFNLARLLANTLVDDTAKSSEFNKWTTRLLSFAADKLGSDSYTLEKLKENSDEALSSLNSLAYLLLAENKATQRPLRIKLKPFFAQSHKSEFSKLESVDSWAKNTLKNYIPD